MTLVVSINGPDTIWLMADRRLSSPGKRPKDDGIKVMLVEATDGKAILGYSGVGATARGTQPADWMAAVLRGRKLSLEASLGAIADAIKREFPRHMLLMPRGGAAAHNVVAAALVDDQARVYTIDIEFSQDRKQYRSRYTRHIVGRTIGTARPRTPRLAVAGSGALYLWKDKRWMRRLLRLAAAHARGRISEYTVADDLAALNHEVHLHDASVGPRCVVVWRHRDGSPRKGGGAQQFYDGTARENNGPILPTIANGMDVGGLIGVLMPRMQKQLEAMKRGETASFDPFDGINAELARLPDKPDEKLR